MLNHFFKNHVIGLEMVLIHILRHSPLLSFCCSSFESVVASQLVRLLDLLRFTSSLPGFSIFRQFFFCFPPSFLPFFFSKALYSSSSSVSCVLTDLIPRPCFWLADIKDSEIVGKVRGGHRSRICPARQQIQIAAENKLKPRPEIACCCHRGQFVSTQDLKYEGGRWWLLPSWKRAHLSCILLTLPNCPPSTVRERVVGQ